MKILGMMSGTSGDGIDGALVDFKEDGKYSLVWHKSFDYNQEVFARIQKLMKPCSSIEVTLGNSYIAELYAKAFRSFFKENDEKPDYIAAHGQTIWHQPQVVRWDDIDLTGTLQLLDAPLLAQRTNIPVINNFRSADMAVGGQGAPLVPYADLILFGNLFPEDCLVLNIGGMANITAIHKNNGDAKVVCAFDTGPGNVLMDAYMQKNNLGNYDKNGTFASSGKTVNSILEDFLKDPYFKQPFPKSTGREHFNTNLLEKFDKKIKNEDVLSTLLDVTVISISDAVVSLKEIINFPCKLIVAGGGALNTELIKRLKRNLADSCSIHTSDEFGIPVMAREAMAFAVLGYAFVKKQPSNVPLATGASKKVILGQLSIV
jgi:anhydro-N-acetylmuramic acid kinase